MDLKLFLKPRTPLRPDVVFLSVIISSNNTYYQANKSHALYSNTLFAHVISSDMYIYDVISSITLISYVISSNTLISYVISSNTLIVYVISSNTINSHKKNFQIQSQRFLAYSEIRTMY